MGNVKVFRSSDYGAPILYGNAGYLIPVLQACLVDGYGTQTPSSITHDGGVVTVTVPIAHGLKVGSRQTIAGVTNDTAYNGEYVLTSVGTYTFTYAKAGITQATGTGTITTKSAGAGWTKPYSGTNLAAFRPGAGNRPFLRINDTTTQAARCLGYESMSDVNTGTGGFPTEAQVSGGLYWPKSSTADATNARQWLLVADDKTMYMWINFNGSTTYADSPVIGFGDYDSVKSGDAFNSFIGACTTATTATSFRFSYLQASFQVAETGWYHMRSYTQVGTAIAAAKISDGAKTANAANMGTGGVVYPHQPDGGLYLAPVWIIETASTLAQSVIRGTLRGIWNPLHNLPLAHEDTFSGSGPLSGKDFLAIRCQASAEFMFDTSLTW